MYYPGEQQFIEDTLLIERLAMMDNAIIKEAGVLSSALGSVANGIKDFARKNIDTSSTEALLKSLANIMVPAVLFRVNPWLMVLERIAASLGFSASSIITSIFSFLKNAFSQGKLPSPNDINNIGAMAVGEQAGSYVNASDDMFGILKQAERDGGIMKFAQRGYFSESVSGPVLFSNKRSILERVFGRLTKQRGKWLLGGFIVWIIKTLLAGAGLLAVGGAVASLFGKDKGGESEGRGVAVEQTSPSAPAQAPVSAPKLLWSGSGTQHHPNTNSSMWYVPMQDVARMLLLWTVDVYPQVNLNKVSRTPSFMTLVTKLQRLKEPDSSYIRIPNRFHTRKQVVDSFIKDVPA